METIILVAKVIVLITVGIIATVNVLRNVRVNDTHDYIGEYQHANAFGYGNN